MKRWRCRRAPSCPGAAPLLAAWWPHEQLRAEGAAAGQVWTSAIEMQPLRPRARATTLFAHPPCAGQERSADGGARAAAGTCRQGCMGALVASPRARRRTLGSCIHIAHAHSRQFCTQVAADPEGGREAAVGEWGAFGPKEERVRWVNRLANLVLLSGKTNSQVRGQRGRGMEGRCCVALGGKRCPHMFDHCERAPVCAAPQPLGAAGR